jgi:hypothetical protein
MKRLQKNGLKIGPPLIELRLLDVQVIRFVFHVLRLLPIIFTQQNFCCVIYRLYDEVSAKKNGLRIGPPSTELRLSDVQVIQFVFHVL